MLGHQHEDFQHGKRCAFEHVGVGCFDIAIMQLKARVERLGTAAGVVGEDDFLEVLDDQVAEFGDAHDHPVVFLHEAFDGALGVIVLEPQQTGDGALVVEQQAVFGAACQHVQGVTHFPQKLLGRRQQVVLAFQQEAFAGQRVQVQGAVLAPGDPENGLDVAQAAG
ncbi:hypothetical protein D9M71_408530 [compost metagenome]